MLGIGSTCYSKQFLSSTSPARVAPGFGDLVRAERECAEEHLSGNAASLASALHPTSGRYREASGGSGSIAPVRETSAVGPEADAQLDREYFRTPDIRTQRYLVGA